MHLNEILVGLKDKMPYIFWTKLGNYGRSGEEGVESSAAPIPLVQTTSLGMMQGRAGNWKKKGWYLSRTFLSIPSNYIRNLLFIYFLHTSIPAFTKKKSLN